MPLARGRKSRGESDPAHLEGTGFQERAGGGFEGRPRRQDVVHEGDPGVAADRLLRLERAADVASTRLAAKRGLGTGRADSVQEILAERPFEPGGDGAGETVDLVEAALASSCGMEGKANHEIDSPSGLLFDPFGERRC